MSDLSCQIAYSQKILITIAQSTYKHYLTCKGAGIEPKIEFSDTMLTFGPVLPHAAGDELEVVVKNSGAFPVEFYSLEFDKKYLEEEKVRKILSQFILYCLGDTVLTRHLTDL